MKKILNKKINTGITLIALVITIVVLIILAAVTINLSLGNNGIFNRAKTAKEQYQNAENYERTEVAKSTNQIDSYVGGDRTSGMPTYNYSYDEQVVGTWVDGKPLYQRTFSMTTSGTSWTLIQHNIVNIEKVVNVFGGGTHESNDIGGCYSGSYAQLYGDKTTVQIKPSTSGTGRYNVTIQYTKTTD